MLEVSIMYVRTGVPKDYSDTPIELGRWQVETKRDRE